MRKILPGFIIILCAGALYSQGPAQEQMVDEIALQFSSGNIYEAEIQALKALHSDIQFSDESLFEIHKYLAFCYVAYGQRDKAVKEFLEMLMLKPDHRFDPQIVSPKIIQVFETALTEFEKNKASIPDISAISASDIQLRAGIKSLAFPGLGQIYKGEKRKGYILIACEAAAITGVAVSQIMLNESHDEYLKAANPQVIRDRYKNYNYWYKARNFTAASAVIIYLYGFFDSIYFHTDIEESGFTILYDHQTNSVSFKINF